MSDDSDVTVSGGVVKLVAIAFGLWAVVLPLAAWLVVSQVETLGNIIAVGILPRADERITQVEREQRQHQEESKRGFDRIRALEREVAILKSEKAARK